MIALFRLCVALFVSPFKSKSRLEAENPAVCTDAAWAQEHSLHRAWRRIGSRISGGDNGDTEKPRETYSPAPRMTLKAILEGTISRIARSTSRDC
jgi:hypothetical protein